MKFIETPLKNAFSIQLDSFEDHRGKFTRLFCSKEFQERNIEKKIVQINDSFTVKKGTIRGLHYQVPPSSEIKIVKCIKGAIFDLIVDIRRNSHTFLQYYGAKLSDKNMKMLVIPEGFAHGFQTLEDNSEMLYFVTAFYNKENERGIRFNDPKINIEWPLEATNVSEKDRNYDLLDENYNGLDI